MRPSNVQMASRFLLLVATLAAWSAAASAQDEMNRSPHTAESSIIVGFKGIQMNAFAEEEGSQFAHHGFGGGFFLETSLVEGWMELEVGLGSIYFPEPDEVELPIDLLLKKPFCFGDIVQAYFAVGPTFALVLNGEELGVQVGGAVAIGSYFWITSAFGIDVEVDYSLLVQDEHPVQELGFALGVVVRI